MTEAQCQTCKAPSAQCQSPQFAHLMNASCLNHTPVAAGEVTWMQRERAPFEQIAIESHDTDQIETLYHMDGCGCPACLRMVRRGYVKEKYTWKNEGVNVSAMNCEAWMNI